LKTKLIRDLDDTVKDTQTSILLMQWDKGKTLAKIRDEKLYLKMRCKTFDRYLSKRKIFRIEAFAVIALSQCFTERELIKLSRKHTYWEIIGKMMLKRKV
jgi:hypothetical protein